MDRALNGLIVLMETIHSRASMMRYVRKLLERVEGVGYGKFKDKYEKWHRFYKRKRVPKMFKTLKTKILE